MTLCRQVNDTVNLLILHELVESIKIADVHLHKLVVGLILYILKVCQVSSISKLVKIDDFIRWILVDKQANHMATDKSSTTCDNNVSRSEEHTSELQSP